MLYLLAVALLGTSSSGECLPVRYSENGKARRTAVSVILRVGQERVQAVRCESGFIVPPVVAGHVGPIDAEMRVRGRVLEFDSLRAGHFQRMYYWKVAVHRPPFKTWPAEDVATHERARGLRVKLIYTLTPESKDGDPITHATYLFRN